MKNDKNIPRRKWLKLGFGLAAGTVGSAFTISKISGDKDNCLLTPRQELGPFPAMKFRGQADHDIDLTKISGQDGIATGEIIVVHGNVIDIDCNPIEGAIVEIWHANHYGKYHHEYDVKGQDDPNFQGWGRLLQMQKANTGSQLYFPVHMPTEPGIYILKFQKEVIMKW